MARQIIDTTTNNGTYIGDPAKTAFEKTNANFSELYSGKANLAGANTFSGGNQLFLSSVYVQPNSGDQLIIREGPDSGSVSISSVNFNNSSFSILGIDCLALRISGLGPYPSEDNLSQNGRASNRWSVIFAATGTINTSDAREKTEVYELSDAEVRAGLILGSEIGKFKFNSSIKEKGDSARFHIGLTVQRAIEIMESCNLSPFDYAFICHDSWESGDGSTSGDMYGFRVDQLNLFINAAISRKLIEVAY